MAENHKCDDHSGVCEAVETLKKNQDTLFKKLDRIYVTALGLLVAVIVDIVIRILPHTGTLAK